MIDYKIKTVRLISSFSHKDSEEFSRFIISPFFNEKQYLALLYKSIKDRINSGEKFDLRGIFSEVFPSKVYSESMTRKALSELNSLILQYFSIVNSNSSPSSELFYSIKELNKRNFSEYVESAIMDFKQMMREDLDSDPVWKFHRIMIIYEEYRLHKSMNNYKKAAASISKISSSLDGLYVQFRLIDYIFTFIRKYREIDFKLNADSFYRFVKEYSAVIESKPVFRLLERTCFLLLDESKKVLKEILDTIASQSGKIYYGVIDLSLSCLLEYLSYRHLTGAVLTASLVNILYKALDNSGYLNRVKIVPPVDFVAVVMLLSLIKNSGFAEEYISKYISKLHPAQRSNIKYVSEAIVLFNKREFQKSFGKLDNISTHDYMLYTISRVLSVECLYELSEYKQALKTLASLKRYLYRRNDIPELSRHSMLEFIKYAQHLIQSRTHLVRKKSALLGNLDHEKNIINRPWLISKSFELNSVRSRLIKAD